MFRKLLVLPVLGLLALPAVVKAQEYGFDAGNWELTLSGQGANDSDFNSTSAAVTGSIGYFLNDNLEIALRETVSYTDASAVPSTAGSGLATTSSRGSSWDGTTTAAVDWHFDLGRWQPFIGANVGYRWGESTSDTWQAGPEAGVKYFLTQSTFVQFIAQYEFFFDHGDNSDSFQNGSFVYGLGLGVKL